MAKAQMEKEELQMMMLLPGYRRALCTTQWATPHQPFQARVQHPALPKRHDAGYDSAKQMSQQQALSFRGGRGDRARVIENEYFTR